MEYTHTYVENLENLTVTHSTLLGDPGRAITKCPQQKPTMQNIIDTVRNNVDAHGKEIYQAVAVPVRDLPHDVQMILEQGGALDWVNRSIDQVIFSHNIIHNLEINGDPQGFGQAMGLTSRPEGWQAYLNAFDGKRTIMVAVPKGNPEIWRTNLSEAYANPFPSFTAEELGETCSIIVHETTHVVDAMNITRNTPHDNPMRMKRFYDRLFGPSGIVERGDIERRAVDAQGIFTQEIHEGGTRELHELPNTHESWNRVRAGLEAFQETSDEFAKNFSPASLLKMKATHFKAIARHKLGSLGEKIGDTLGIDELSTNTRANASPDLFEAFKSGRSETDGLVRGGGGGGRGADISSAAFPPALSLPPPTLGLGR